MWFNGKTIPLSSHVVIYEGDDTVSCIVIYVHLKLKLLSGKHILSLYHLGLLPFAMLS